MIIATVHEAKTHLSRLLAAAEAGEEVTIARGSKPIARLVAIEPVKKSKRELGWLAHTVPPGTDLDAPGLWDPVSDEEIASWEGENDGWWTTRSSSTHTR